MGSCRLLEPGRDVWVSHVERSPKGSPAQSRERTIVCSGGTVPAMTVRVRIHDCYGRVLTFACLSPRGQLRASAYVFKPDNRA
ncbi:hypothetical protein R1flu_019605 [Riccia fluitans]|uniref:Uncharacterized protein n=1 Tax=Riccia fluitans TaxID=41844 RepID=A0ABD1ZJH2_9MARC